MATITSQAASRFDNLVANPPFGQSASPSQFRTDAPNQPLEFRGISIEQGQQFFSFYDPATKRSRWVILNDADDGLLLKSYDEAAHTATVDFNGRPLTLALKSGPKFAQAQSAPGLPPPGAPAGGPLPGQAATLPGMSAKGQNPEATRLQQIAEEIRRRRALRSQVPQMQMPQQPAQSGATGGPMPMPQSGSPSGSMVIPNATPGQGPMPLPGQTSSGGPVPMPAQ